MWTTHLVAFALVPRYLRCCLVLRRSCGPLPLKVSAHVKIQATYRPKSNAAKIALKNSGYLVLGDS